MTFSFGGLVSGAAGARAQQLRGQTAGLEQDAATRRQIQLDAMKQALDTANIGHLNAEAWRALHPEPRDLDPLSQAGIAAYTQRYNATQGASKAPQLPWVDAGYQNTTEGRKQWLADSRAHAQATDVVPHYPPGYMVNDPESFDPTNPKDKSRFLQREIRTAMAGRFDPLTGITQPGMSGLEATKQARNTWDAFVTSLSPATTPIAPQPDQGAAFGATINQMTGGGLTGGRKPFQDRLTELQQGGASREQARAQMTSEGYLDQQGRIIAP